MIFGCKHSAKSHDPSSKNSDRLRQKSWSMCSHQTTPPAGFASPRCRSFAPSRVKWLLSLPCAPWLIHHWWTEQNWCLTPEYLWFGSRCYPSSLPSLHPSSLVSFPESPGPWVSRPGHMHPIDKLMDEPNLAFGRVYVCAFVFTSFYVRVIPERRQLFLSDWDFPQIWFDRKEKQSKVNVIYRQKMIKQRSTVR